MTQSASAILAGLDAVSDHQISAYYATPAQYADSAAASNVPKLRMLYRVSAASLALLMLDLAGWIWTLALNNGVRDDQRPRPRLEHHTSAW